MCLLVFIMVSVFCDPLQVFRRMRWGIEIWKERQVDAQKDGRSMDELIDWWVVGHTQIHGGRDRETDEQTRGQMDRWTCRWVAG